MKPIMNKAFDGLCLIGGPIVFAVSDFYYHHNHLYYKDLGMAIGIGLVLVGFLRVYWRRSK